MLARMRSCHLRSSILLSAQNAKRFKSTAIQLITDGEIVAHLNFENNLIFEDAYLDNDESSDFYCQRIIISERYVDFIAQATLSDRLRKSVRILALDVFDINPELVLKLYAKLKSIFYNIKKFELSVILHVSASNMNEIQQLFEIEVIDELFLWNTPSATNLTVAQLPGLTLYFEYYEKKKIDKENIMFLSKLDLTSNFDIFKHEFNSCIN